MVGPVPGIAPNIVPIKVPRSIGKNERFSSALLGRMSRRLTLTPLPTASMRLTLSRNSVTPNSPSASATSSTLSESSISPKVKRCVPLLTSVPTMPIIRPITVIATPCSGEPLDMVPPHSRPSSMIEKISVGPNSNAMLTSRGDAKIITMMPNEAAKNEEIMVMPSAVPPVPCLVSG